MALLWLIPYALHSILDYSKNNTSTNSGCCHYTVIRRLLDNFRAAFLRNQPDTLLVRDNTQVPQIADSTRDNSLQDSISTSWWRTIFVTSLGVTVLVLGVRKLGWLQQWELDAYDKMMLSRPSELPDERILLVTVTQEDLQGYSNNNSLSDETVNQLLKKIKSYEPRVIGLQIKHSQQTNLATVLNKDNITAACVLSAMGEPEIAPPPNFVRDNVFSDLITNIAFSDLVPDNTFDHVVRRGLLFATSSPDSKCHTRFSFSSNLAIKYLAKQGIEHSFPDNVFYLGNVPFPRLQKNSGGYINIENDGYQIIINYRNHRNVAKTVSLTQVLTNKVNPNLFKDRLVIIGNDGRRRDRGRLTPYSNSKEPPRVPRLFIHAQITSQLISAVLDGRPLIWYFPEWLEGLWVLSWSIVGGVLAWR
ncbi:MAG: CHASE2 domain-containing protein, partial [Cyanobacteria bacterium P01_D01_bin.50]